MKVSHTAPLKLSNGNNLTRRFLGNLFPENGFEKNELKAYIKGTPLFRYGMDENRNPVYYKVRQEYFYS